MIKIINKIDLSSFIDLIYLIDKILVISFNILNIVNKKLINFGKSVNPALGVQSWSWQITIEPWLLIY